MIILIDNGHGQETAGKRSPDGRLREYKYAREIAAEVVKRLKAQGYNAQQLVTEENDISLGTRCKRVNDICKHFGASNVLLVSVHCNAAGSGAKWMTAGGWSAYTTEGKTNADLLATHLYTAARNNLAEYEKLMNAGKQLGKYDKKQVPYRIDTADGDPDLESDFYILKKTSCPAVLTENLFQDNRQDVDYLLSEEGRKTIINLHIEGIINYIKSL